MALSDETLTAARDKLTATRTAVQGLLSGLDTSGSAVAAPDDGSARGDCPAAVHAPTRPCLSELSACHQHRPRPRKEGVNR